eukprot:7382592-Prymnesium_polylepis.1
MPLVLSADALSSVLLRLTAKQLCAVSLTCQELHTAARDALDAPRLAERKRWAALGAALLRACETGEAWFHDQYAPDDPELRSMLEDFEARHWCRNESRSIRCGGGRGAHLEHGARPLQVGMRVCFELSSGAGWGQGIVKALPSDEMAEVATEQAADVTLGAEHVCALWPAKADLAAGVRAIQDWDPRAFAYIMMRQTIHSEMDLLLVAEYDLTIEQTDEGKQILRRVDEPVLVTLLEAVGEWDDDISLNGLSRWFAESMETTLCHMDTTRPEQVMATVFQCFETLSDKSSAKIFSLFYGRGTSSVAWHLAQADSHKKRYESDSVQWLTQRNVLALLLRTHSDGGMFAEFIGGLLHECLKTADEVAVLVDTLWVLHDDHAREQLDTDSQSDSDHVSCELSMEEAGWIVSEVCPPARGCSRHWHTLLPQPHPCWQVIGRNLQLEVTVLDSVAAQLEALQERLSAGEAMWQERASNFLGAVFDYDLSPDDT